MDAFDYFDNFDDFDDIEIIIRIPKRYLRGVKNPLEFFDNDEFKQRYRFSKDIIVHVVFPLVQPQLERGNLRGLPILPLYQLLTTLRFYATGNFQES